MVMDVFFLGCALISLLVIVVAIVRGRLYIENVCDLKVKEKPVTFIAVMLWAIVLAGGIAYLCGFGMWQSFIHTVPL